MSAAPCTVRQISEKIRQIFPGMFLSENNFSMGHTRARLLLTCTSFFSIPHPSCLIAVSYIAALPAPTQQQGLCLSAAPAVVRMQATPLSRLRRWVLRWW